MIYKNINILIISNITKYF